MNYISIERSEVLFQYSNFEVVFGTSPVLFGCNTCNTSEHVPIVCNIVLPFQVGGRLLHSTSKMLFLSQF